MDFGSGMSTAASARAAAREAIEQARAPFAGTRPKLALVFASASYEDLEEIPRTVREAIGDVPVVGGTSGGAVLGADTVAARGVSVVLLGGDDIDVDVRVAALGSPELVGVVPAAQEIARAAGEARDRGLPHFVCLVFAPGMFVDGEALVAAVRKGAGAHAELAGGLSGDDLAMDRPQIFVGDELRSDRVVLSGVFTRKHVGIAARHGWRAVGPTRTVTRADGPVLFELDHRPALEVWLEDARRAGATPPEDLKELAFYLASYYELGLDPPRGADKDDGELVVRVPWRVGAGGSLELSGSIGERRRVRVVHASRNDLLRAATDAAADATMRAGGRVAGAVVLASTGRLIALDDDFPREAGLIRERVAAPIGGACVFGEIAKNARDIDAFFNTTVLVVAFAA